MSKPRAVIRLDTSERFLSVAQAARSLHCLASEVRRACVHGYAVHGIALAYADSESIPTRRTRGTAIVCLETGRMYASMREASDDLDVSAETVRRAVASGKPVRNLHLRIAAKPHKRDETKQGEIKAIWCVETCETFTSVTEAALLLGASRSQVSRCASSGGGVHGFHLSRIPVAGNGGRARCYETNIEGLTVREVFVASGGMDARCPKSLRGWSDSGLHVFNPEAQGYVPNRAAKSAGREVRCLDTNVLFPSVALAAATYDIPITSVARACEAHATAGGLSFRWA